MTEGRVWGEWAAELGDVDVEGLAALEDALGAGDGLPRGPVVDVHTHLGRDADGHHLAPEALLADMDRHGVARAVCFPANEPGDGVPFEAANHAVCQAARRYPDRIVPFCRADPLHLGMDAVERAAADGARGLKLHPVAQGFSPDAPVVVALVEAATERGWPVLFHAGYGARALARPFATLLDAVPSARVILAHAARGDARDVWDMARERPNVWWDTSLAALVDVVQLPPSRLLFGVDRPYGEHATARQLVSLAARVAGWSRRDVEAVLWGNAERLLGRAT